MNYNKSNHYNDFDYCFIQNVSILVTIGYNSFSNRMYFREQRKKWHKCTDAEHSVCEIKRGS